MMNEYTDFVDFVEIGFRKGDLIKIREDQKVRVIKGIYENHKKSTNGFQEDIEGENCPPLLFLGCKLVTRREHEPKMVLAFIHKDAAWHTFFYNAMHINQYFEKVKF